MATCINAVSKQRGANKLSRSIHLQEHKPKSGVQAHEQPEGADSPFLNNSLSLIAGALFASLGFYLLHDDVWDQSVRLAASVASMTEIKTRQQLEKVRRNTFTLLK